MIMCRNHTKIVNKRIECDTLYFAYFKKKILNGPEYLSRVLLKFEIGIGSFHVKWFSAPHLTFFDFEAIQHKR